MQRAIRVAAALLSIVGACGGSDGPSGARVSKLEIVSGDGQTGTAGTALPIPLTVRAKGADGAPVAGVGIAFGGDGSVSPSEPTTDANGLASATWTLGTDGSVAGVASFVTAVVPNQPPTADTRARFSALSLSGPLAQVLVIQPQELLVGGSLQFSAALHDAFGNDVAPQPVSWASSNTAVVGLTSGGVATGLALGSSTVTATAGAVQGSRFVAVNNVSSFRTSATVRIDGVLAADEWAHAPSVGFDVRFADGPGGTVPAHLFVMNDAQNLYLGLGMDRATPERSDVEVELDKDGSGSTTLGDDSLLARSDLFFSDGVWRFGGSGCSADLVCPDADTTVMGSNDGAAFFLNGTTSAAYEISHPLHSGDPNDVALVAGQRIGIKISVRIIGNPTGVFDTPFPFERYLLVTIN